MVSGALTAVSVVVWLSASSITGDAGLMGSVTGNGTGDGTEDAYGAAGGVAVGTSFDTGIGTAVGAAIGAVEVTRTGTAVKRSNTSVRLPI